MKKALLTLLALSTLLVGCKKEPVKVQSISFNPTSLSLVAETSGQIVASVLPDNAENKTLQWSSDDENVATVDQTGKVNAIAAGTAQIKAAATDGGGAQATLTVTVTAKPVPVTRVDLSYSSYKMKVGDIVQNGASVQPENATVQTVTWSSSAESVATVDQTGKMTAVAAGTATIKATANDGSGKYAECAVTVVTPKDVFLTIPFAIMKIDPACKSITLKAYYGKISEYGSREDLVDPSWTSDNESVVTVSAAGKLTAVAPGTAKITVMDADFNSATCDVTVLPNTVKPADYLRGVKATNCAPTIPAEQTSDWAWYTKGSTLSLAEGYAAGTQCIANADVGSYRIFQCVFDTPVDVSTMRNPALFFRLYAEDPTKIYLGAAGQLELTSAGTADSEELTWELNDVFTNDASHTAKAKLELKQGWNTVILPFSSVTAKAGEIRLNHIDFFRFYQYNVNMITGGNFRLDQLRIIDWSEFDVCENYEMWYDGNTVPQRQCTFDTADKKQGNGSIAYKQYFFEGADAFRLKFWTGAEYCMPFDMDKSNAVAKLWLYTDKPEFFNNQILNLEFSSNMNTADVFTWTIAPNSLNLKSGWNELTLPFAAAASSGKADVRFINWMRFVWQFTGGSATPTPTVADLKIDDIRIEKATN